MSRSASDETLAEEADAVQADDGAESDTETDGESDAETDGESGSESSADSGDGDGAGTVTTLAPEPTPPPPTAPAADIALAVDFGDETWDLTHGELNEVIIPTWESEEFVTRAFGGVVPPGFYAGVANEFLIGKIIDRELDSAGGSVSDTDEQQARENLLGIMQSWYPEAADPVASAEGLYDEVPYLPFVVGLQASQSAISSSLADSEELTVEAPCVRHILVEEEASAQEVLALLDDGGDFAALATEYSTGPSGPNGGDLGCAPTDGYVPEFAEAVNTAEVGAFVGPVETQFGWHVLVVEGYEETQTDPTQVVNGRIGAALESLSIEVDPRIGSWDAASFSILPSASE